MPHSTVGETRLVTAGFARMINNVSNFGITDKQVSPVFVIFAFFSCLFACFFVLYILKSELIQNINYPFRQICFFQGRYRGFNNNSSMLEFNQNAIEVLKNSIKTVKIFVILSTKSTKESI